MFGLTLVNRPMFFDNLVSKLRASEPMFLFDDEWRAPLDLHTAARCLLALVPAGINGLVHLGGLERISRFEMGLRVAKHLGCAQSLVQSIHSEQERQDEPRPRDLSLDTSRLRATLPDFEFPSWDEALHEVCNLSTRQSVF